MNRCKNCNSELITIPFGKGGYHVCDNWHCHIYREAQGIFFNNPTKATPKQTKKKTKRHPGYQRYLAKRLENYRRLRNLKVPANLASRYRDFSSCALLEAQIEAAGRVTEEVISWAKDRRRAIRARRKERAIIHG